MVLVATSLVVMAQWPLEYWLCLLILREEQPQGQAERHRMTQPPRVASLRVRLPAGHRFHLPLLVSVQLELLRFPQELLALELAQGSLGVEGQLTLWLVRSS